MESHIPRDQTGIRELYEVHFQYLLHLHNRFLIFSDREEDFNNLILRSHLINQRSKQTNREYCRQGMLCFEYEMMVLLQIKIK